jgi:hypothetical protein
LDDGFGLATGVGFIRASDNAISSTCAKSKLVTKIAVARSQIEPFYGHFIHRGAHVDRSIAEAQHNTSPSRLATDARVDASLPRKRFTKASAPPWARGSPHSLYV